MALVCKDWDDGGWHCPYDPKLAALWMAKYCPPEPPRALEAWERVDCECSWCYNAWMRRQVQPDRAAPVRTHPPPECLRWQARTHMLEERGFARFETVDNSAGTVSATREFKPATDAQIAEWSSWLESWMSNPEICAAWERAARKRKFEDKWKQVMESLNRNILDKLARRAWTDHKFDVFRMEWLLDGMWPEERKEFMDSPKMRAYVSFGRMQHMLLRSYDSVKENITTDEDYNEAEEAYKALLRHVTTHGQLIREMPGREHKKPVKAVAASSHKGRRALRREAQVERSALAVEADD